MTTTSSMTVDGARSNASAGSPRTGSGSLKDAIASTVAHIMNPVRFFAFDAPGDAS